MMRTRHLAALALTLLLALATVSALAQTPAQTPDPTQRPADFVDISELIPDVVLDIRYITAHNFLGRPVKGYEAPKCLLTRRAAQALVMVQNELRPQGLSLKIYDCFRPQRAVNDFVAWAKDVSDVTAKPEFYPTLEKEVLFPQHYIAERSGHSRGSTVDLAIVPVPTPSQPAWDPGSQVACFKPAAQRYQDNILDFGTGFDCFHELSHSLNPEVGPVQRAHRALLRTLMDRYGFNHLPSEWWHYGLRNEPYPDTYFDFPVR